MAIRRIFQKTQNLFKQIVLLIIRLYQKTFSPDHGIFSYRHPYGYCRFQPTCSEYSHQAIKRHGLWQGSKLGAKRIIRCNPFNKGGNDPVPQKV